MISIALHFESVTDAPDGFDVLGLRGVHFDFFADLFDVDGDGGDVADRVHFPDFAEEFGLCVDVVRVGCEEVEEVVFLCGKLDLLTVYKNAAGLRFDAEAADFDRTGRRFFLRLSLTAEVLITAEVCLDADAEKGFVM